MSSLASSPTLPLHPRKRSLGGKHGTSSVFIVRLEMGLAWGFLFFLIPQDLLVTELPASAPGTAGEYSCCGLQMGRVGREATPEDRWSDLLLMAAWAGGQAHLPSEKEAVKWKRGAMCTLYFPLGMVF